MASSMEEAPAGTQEQPIPRLQIYTTSDTVSPFWREKYEREAKKYWDIFYKRHQDRFFKDRHYLDKEWGQYVSVNEELSWLHSLAVEQEILFFHWLHHTQTFLSMLVIFHRNAVNLVKKHKDFAESRVNAFVCDLTIDDDLSKQISPSSVDIVTMIFVSSAVSPEKMSLVVQNIRKILKPSGRVLFRDYATADVAQERLNCKDQKISENFYARGDGTRAFYFSIEFLTSLFKENGFDVEEFNLCCKQVENRLRELAALILCHIFRRVDEPSILSAASRFDFKLIEKWPVESLSTPSQGIINSWFPEHASADASRGPLHILYFHKE